MGAVFAAKEIAIDERDERDVKFMDALKNEVSIMQELEHPNVVAFLGHEYINRSMYMYMEHMPGGSITQALQQFGPFEENLIDSYSMQILRGLEYLHTRESTVIHRDIKGANILLGVEGGECVAKLADFGCSKRTDAS